MPAATKVQLIQRLARAGLPTVEATSFVSPKWVPQMADAQAVYSQVAAWKKKEELATSLPALVPNLRGLESALEVGVEEIAVFGAASETFSQKNINCSIAESLKRFAPVVAQARARAIRVRGYVSCVMGCPYEGDVEPKRVDEVASALLEMGCYEVSLGDTIGVGTPEKTAALLAALSVPTERLAAHFHNTYGRAVPNLAVALSVRGGSLTAEGHCGDRQQCGGAGGLSLRRGGLRERGH